MYSDLLPKFYIIFPDSNKVILGKEGWEQALLLVLWAICSKYALYLSWISNNSQKYEGMMQLLITDALLFNCRILPRG